MYKKQNQYDVTLETYTSIKQKLNSIRDLLPNKIFLLGFDGYIDLLYSVVDNRNSASNWTRMKSMKTMGELLLKTAGSSLGMERVLKRYTAGGFTSNTCKGISTLGAKVNLIAAWGYPELDDTFRSIASKENVEVISISNPGQTLGLEFDDGKVMLTDFGNILNLDWEYIIKKIGFEKLLNYIEISDTIGIGYWSSIPKLSEIWVHMLEDVFPSISKLKNKLFFTDLADLERRNRNDILNMLEILREFNEYIPVMLTLNDHEAVVISNLLENVKSIEQTKDIHYIYNESGKLINDELNLFYLVIHSPHFATISSEKVHHWISHTFTSQPKFTTAAGDHFNSGISIGLTCNLDPAEAILLGNSLTSVFIRTGYSPNFNQLTSFINNYMDYVDIDNPNFP